MAEATYVGACKEIDKIKTVITVNCILSHEQDERGLRLGGKLKENQTARVSCLTRNLMMIHQSHGYKKRHRISYQKDRIGKCEN